MQVGRDGVDQPGLQRLLAETARALSIISSARVTACAPRQSARQRTVAFMISLTLAASVVPMSSPCEPTGLAAPMAVSGAIAAACPARVIIVPAEPAMAPAGET